jgi:hypothetical protein
MWVENVGDVVTESSGEGQDTIRTTISFTLASHVEVLDLNGTANIDGTGTSASESFYGNSGNNVLSGLSGNDVYVIAGLGEGADTIFDNGLNSDSDQLRISPLGGLTRNNIAIFQNGNNLEIAYVGATTASNRITIQNHFLAGDASRMENITFTGGSFFLTHTAITTVISNMASYASANSISLTDIDVVKNNASLMAIVNAGWSS